MFTALVRKCANLCEILQLPGGLSLKLREPSYSRTDLAACVRLRQSGIFPASIIDVGANIGQFAVSAAVTWPGTPIISFEPIPEAFDQLRKAACRHPVITPVNLALGDQAGEATFHLASQSQSSSLLPLGSRHLAAYSHICPVGTMKVPVSTLATELSCHSSPRPRLLKLDVQGFESRVLAGAGACLSEFEWIFLETSTTPMYEGEKGFFEICTQLAPWGFYFSFPVHLHLSPSGAICQFDALFMKNSAAGNAGK